ncbi:MAG: tRNA pseudouridine(13) synthase TruD, partial [Archangium sp.]|nr:tRNA pseudouridine(13) synthase TruD [Archangium sp.]
HDVDMQEDMLRLKYLGRTDRALSAANITSNRFAVTVRHVRRDELQPLTLATAEVARMGVVNYFDSQRFGSLKHGQGFIAKDLIRGDFEAALKNHLAKPSPLDQTEDAKVKGFWAANWGDWGARCPYPSNRKYARIFKALRDEPTNFVKAFLQIDSSYRAMLLFTYQSYLWNEGVRRLLQILLPREHLFPMPYQAGTLLHHRDAPSEVLRYLRDATFPLLAPDSTFSDPKVEEAVKWVMGREKLTFEQLRIEEAPKLLFFKHEERPLLVSPAKLVVGKERPDELNRGFSKVNIAFTLPPGSYATLVVKRLFHFAFKKESDFEGERYAKVEAPPAQTTRVDTSDDDDDDDDEVATPKRRGPAANAGAGAPQRPSTRSTKPAAPPHAVAAPATPAMGYRERQRQKKALRAERRAENTHK